MRDYLLGYRDGFNDGSANVKPRDLSKVSADYLAGYNDGYYEGF